MFVALLDACVLVPITLADTLLRAGEAELYHPLWSREVIDETRSAIAVVNPELSASRIDARLKAMASTFPESEIAGHETLIETFELPDTRDRHVVAAARLGHADAIVTRNVRDFPEAVLSGFGLHVIEPDEFLLDMYDLAPETMKRIITQQARDAKNPPLDVADVVINLGRAGAPGFAKLIGQELA